MKGKSLLTTVTLDVKVDLIYPSESGRGGITILPRRTKTFSGINTIAEYNIQENDPEGTYVFRVTAWDTSGNLIGQIDIPFQVVGEEKIPMEAIIVIIAAAVIIILSITLVVKRRRQQQRIEAQQLPSQEFPTPMGGKTVVIKPGTISIQGPGGETQVVTAYFQLGNHIIPISSLPQSFGREDFTGMVPENILRSISRRMKPQFTIHYDYSRGCFIIKDDNSTNGTYVNNENIQGKGWIPLKNGDIVNLARILNLKFVVSPGKMGAPL